MMKLVVHVLTLLCLACAGYGRREVPSSKKSGKKGTPAPIVLKIVELETEFLDSGPAIGAFNPFTADIWYQNEAMDGIEGMKIGVSRGFCLRTANVTTDGGHCSWTLTLVDEWGEEHKLNVLGDAATLEWDVYQVLSVVGGTGMYVGAKGEVHIIAKPFELEGNQEVGFFSTIYLKLDH